MSNIRNTDKSPIEALFERIAAAWETAQAYDVIPELVQAYPEYQEQLYDFLRLRVEAELLESLPVEEVCQINRAVRERLRQYGVELSWANEDRFVQGGLQVMDDSLPSRENKDTELQTGLTEKIAGDFLRTLWKNRLRVLMTNLAADEQEYREIANLAAHIGADYHGRFLIEVLQNAGDQALKAGITDSTVTIVRSAEILAVANQGAPFDAAGIRAITSLGVSPKDPRFAIGNKGVGFKAVFQVTASPEIYTASSITQTFLDDDAVRFRLDQSPLDDIMLIEELRTLAQEIFARHPELAAELMKKRPDVADPVALVLAEARAAAPFKFPLPLAADTLAARIRPLALPPACEKHCQTLIVLPLLHNEETTTVVDTAIQELLSCSGAIGLFLPGVRRIALIDHVHDIQYEIVRSESDPSEKLSRGVYFRRLATSITSTTKDHRALQKTQWWCVSRTIGSDAGVDPATAEAERETIRKAASVLPGEGWNKVDTATVSVALPMPDPTTPPGTPLGPNGRICIGLPTHDRTGTPAWVDARFHGTISRKGCDLHGLQYNRLLFEEAVQLMGDLVVRLKSDPDIGARRAITLAMETAGGPLADAIRKPEGLAHRAIILDVSGQGFTRAALLALPACEDMEMFEECMAAMADASLYGFHLPDRDLLTHARGLLETLSGVERQTPSPDRRFLTRSHGERSLLERSAADHRHDRHDFWQPFLEWVMTRFPVADLQEQSILPVGEGELATPDSRVFWRPLPRDGVSAVEDGEEEVETLHEAVGRALRFLDEKAVQVREAHRRTLTPLARKLAPESGLGLVRRPRREDLLNDALAPRLQEIAEEPTQVRLAVLLLEQAVEWLRQMPSTGRGRVELDALRVPTSGQAGEWKWVSPREVYFGPGWLDDRTNELLTQAYGGTLGRQLVSWDTFAERGAIDPDRRAWWVDGMRKIVNASPKKIEAPRSRKAPMVSRNYNYLIRMPDVVCPLPQASAYWDRYLDDIKDRPARTKSGRHFDVKEILWIDGLEDAHARAAVVELILSHPEDYGSSLETSLERADGSGDRTTVPSLWVHALRNEGWQVVPTNAGLREPEKVWWLEAEQRRRQQDRYSHLHCVPARFANAVPVLRALGVTTLEEAPIARLVDTLQDLAHMLVQLEPEQKRSARALVTELYTRLQCLCENQAALVERKTIFDRPVPLQQGPYLVPVNLMSAEVVYIDDDPVRAQFIANFDAAYKLPLSVRSPHASLLAALRELLGAERVLRTSEASVTTGFIHTPGRPAPLLLEYLGEHFPDATVAMDLGLLFAFGGRTPTAPTGDEFRRTWARISKTRLQCGQFPSVAGSRSFFDVHAPEGLVLQVSETLQPWEIVEASWVIVGPGYRDLWAAYARTLHQQQVEQFFAERQIGAAERDEIEAAIGSSLAERLRPLQPALFAIWRQRHLEAPIEEFYRAWKEGMRCLEDVQAWLGVPNLEAMLVQARDHSEEEASLFVIEAAGISVPRWQKAREELGLRRWHFAASERLYEAAKDSLAAGLMAVAAHSVSVNLSVAQGFIIALKPLSPETMITENPPDPATIIDALLCSAVELVEGLQNRSAVDLLATRLRTLKANAPSGVQDIVPEDAAKREIELYRYEPEGRRTLQAQETTRGLLKVAVALAEKLDERLDADGITRNPRVAALSAGWWANRFAVLAAIQHALAQEAPETVTQMSAQRAFHDPAPWQELWTRFFPVLPKLSPSTASQPSSQQVSLLGTTRSQEELFQDLSLGSGGTLGKKLSEAVDPTLALAALRDTHRQVTTVPATRWSGTGSGTTRIPRMHEDNQDTAITGLLGEAFVYEQLRKILGNFDETSWVSTNRTRYGLDSTGSDAHGCDFIYRDVDGTLTGSTDQPECLIEVKATSEDGSGPFPISMSEWEKALSCHESCGRQIYVIVRVHHVRTAPAISDILVDPIRLWTTQRIAYAAKDLWVYVGRPVESATDQVDMKEVE